MNQYIKSGLTFLADIAKTLFFAFLLMVVLFSFAWIFNIFGYDYMLIYEHSTGGIDRYLSEGGRMIVLLSIFIFAVFIVGIVYFMVLLFNYNSKNRDTLTVSGIDLEEDHIVDDLGINAEKL